MSNFERSLATAAPLTYTIKGLVESAPGLSRSAVYVALRDKKLSAKKLGKRTIITADEAERFIQNLPDYASETA
jgi:hypothetical protein